MFTNTVTLTEFVSKASQLCSRMVTQSGIGASTLRQIKNHSKDIVCTSPLFLLGDGGEGGGGGGG